MGSYRSQTQIHKKERKSEQNLGLLKEIKCGRKQVRTFQDSFLSKTFFRSLTFFVQKKKIQLNSMGKFSSLSNKNTLEDKWGEN